MKRILLGLLVVGSVAGVATLATNAFFSDTATSTGNTFQAGNLKLQVKSQCSYNGSSETTQCGNFVYSEGILAKFFDFTDVKPGDWGENTISFRVDDNDAWMCANLTGTQVGTLADYLNVVWWVDSNGNNKIDPGEKVLYGGPRTFSQWLDLGTGNVLPLTFADSYLNWETWTGSYTAPNTTPIMGGSENHLGVAWCFGTMSVTADGNPGFTCVGSGDQNAAQGTTVMADLNFSIEQYRNNPDFRCPEHRQ